MAAGLPQLPQELREQRAEAVMNIQANVMARRQEEKVGRTVQVICDGYDDENDLYICRTRADAPDIDAECCVRSETPLEPGAFYRVTCTGLWPKADAAAGTPIVRASFSGAPKRSFER